jgi:hypothetical protein
MLNIVIIKLKVTELGKHNSNIFRIGHEECVDASILYGTNIKSDSILKCENRGSRYDSFGAVG